MVGFRFIYVIQRKSISNCAFYLFVVQTSIILDINIRHTIFYSIDFDYLSKPEIIKIKTESGDVEEKWTGNYLFENEWQSFRTKKDPTLEFTSIAYEYKQSGKYKVMVKVVDILGIDTSKIIEVNI